MTLGGSACIFTEFKLKTTKLLLFCVRFTVAIRVILLFVHLYLIHGDIHIEATTLNYMNMLIYMINNWGYT
jgi:hypothetical protein